MKLNGLNGAQTSWTRWLVVSITLDCLVSGHAPTWPAALAHKCEPVVSSSDFTPLSYALNKDDVVKHKHFCVENIVNGWMLKCFIVEMFYISHDDMPRHVTLAYLDPPLKGLKMNTTLGLTYSDSSVWKLSLLCHSKPAFLHLTNSNEDIF